MDGAVTSRNTLERLAELEMRLGGGTYDQDSGRRSEIARIAKIACTQCGSCGKTIAAGEHVTRQRIDLRFYNAWIWTTAPLCDNCARPKRWYVTRPCENCDRRVTYDGARGRCFCSDNCRRVEQQRARKADRLESRVGKRCYGCSERFTPPRSDAKFCSPACRQRAYRERKFVRGSR